MTAMVLLDLYWISITGLCKEMAVSTCGGQTIQTNVFILPSTSVDFWCCCVTPRIVYYTVATDYTVLAAKQQH